MTHAPLIRKGVTSKTKPTGGHPIARNSFVGLGVSRARSAGGFPLPIGVRQVMESDLHQNFSSVRVHADEQAAGLSSAVGANAFTVGQDVFFANDKFRPQSRDGRQLLAHELGHVADQPRGDDHVVRRDPIKDQARDAIMSGDPESPALKTPWEIAEIILAKAQGAANDSTANQFVTEAIGVIFDVCQSSVNPDFGGYLGAVGFGGIYRIWIAENFFQLLTAEALDKITVHPDGVAILRQMAAILGNGHSLVVGILGDYFGQVSDESLAKIEAQNFPSDERADGNTYANYCMHAILGNIENVAGKDARDAIKALADSERATKVAELTEQLKDGQGDLTDKDKEKIADAELPLNSQNLNAATALGYAQYLGVCDPVRNVCKNAIRHDAIDNPFQGDPFSFNTKFKAYDTFFSPDPLQAMVNAVAGANAGTYMFMASVAQHHSATLLLVKAQDGPATSASDYTLYWNDQYNDGAKAKVVDLNPKTNPETDPAKKKEKKVSVDVGDGIHGKDDERYISDRKDTYLLDPPKKAPKGKLGKKLSHAEFIKKIFYYTEGWASNPDNGIFWNSPTDHTIYTGRTVADDTGRTAIEKNARNQRCTNAHGIELWHITPDRR